MKKVLTILVALALTIGLCACGGPEPKTYKVTYGMANDNLDALQDEQFLGANVKFLTEADSRFYVEFTLELDGKEGYNLKSECYVIESGKRAEPGDETGIGIVWVVNATGKYTENEDGTIKIAAAEKVSREIVSDTYSSQMTALFGVEDQNKTSEEDAELLKLVPETVFTVNEEGAIVSYEVAK